MSTTSLMPLAFIAVGLFVLEGFFFLYCFQWLAAGKRTREREFARLDIERSEIIELQSSLLRDIEVAKSTTDESVRRLNLIGSEVHAEWLEMNQKMAASFQEVETKTAHHFERKLGELNLQRLGLEKAAREAAELNSALSDSIQASRKVLRFFEKNIPADEIVKELKTEKYSEAKRLIHEGHDASQIAKRLGLSLSEISLLSHMG